MNPEPDDLDKSCFFSALQRKQNDLYGQAQRECDIICIPLNRSMYGVDIDYNFIESHIFKASSYFKSHYHTMQSNKVMEVDDDGYVITQKGYSVYKKIRIRSEEVAYNKEFRAYKILWIDEPLLATAHNHTRFTADSLSEQPAAPIQTLVESRKFLELFTHHSQIFRQLHDDISAFKSCYVLLPEYLPDAANRLRQITEKTSHKILTSCDSSAMDPITRINICQCTENVLLDKVHSRVFAVVCDSVKQDDTKLMAKFAHLKSVTSTHLGVKPQLICSMTSAIVELCTLNMYSTPIEKLYCLKRTVDEVINSVHNHMISNNPGQVGFVSSDDLLILLVPVICQARLSHPLANLYYMENYRWFSSNKDELGYILVSFKAVVEYIQTLQLNKQDEKELDTLPSAIVSKEMERVYRNFQNALGEISVTPGQSRLAEMLRKSTRAKDPPPPDVVPANDERQNNLSELIRAIEGSVLRASRQLPK